MLNITLRLVLLFSPSNFELFCLHVVASGYSLVCLNSPFTGILQPPPPPAGQSSCGGLVRRSARWTQFTFTPGGAIWRTPGKRYSIGFSAFLSRSRQRIFVRIFMYFSHARRVKCDSICCRMHKWLWTSCATRRSSWSTYAPRTLWTAIQS